MVHDVERHQRQHRADRPDRDRSGGPPGRSSRLSGVTLARTGRQVSVFVRSTGDRVYLRRSADDGASWAGCTSRGRHLDQRALGRLLGRGAGRPRSPAWPRVPSCSRGTRRSVDSGRPTSVATSSRSTPSRWAMAPSTSSPSRGAAWPSAALRQAALERLGGRGWQLHLRAVGVGRSHTQRHRRQRPRTDGATTSASSPRARPPGPGAPAPTGSRAGPTVRWATPGPASPGSPSERRPTGAPSCSAVHWWSPRRRCGPPPATSCRARTAASSWPVVVVTARCGSPMVARRATRAVRLGGVVR